MVPGSLLLALVPVVAVAFVFFHYRRKARSRRAEREARERALLQELGMAVPPGAGVVNAPVERTVAVSHVLAAPPRIAARDAVLDPQRALAYLLLKTSLPEYHVWPRLPLAELFDRDLERGSLALPHVLLDFVICSSSLSPQVIVSLADPGETHPADEMLARAGMRHVKLSAGALPRRETIRDALGLPQNHARAV